MDSIELLAALRRPESYTFPGAPLIVLQTHISLVVLAGPFAFKVKKPVHFDFLDFSTLERRKFFCEREVALNRRLAPDAYLGVVPIVRTGSGVLVEGEGEGEIIEWAVKMRRLDEQATLETQFADQQRPLAALKQLERLAARLAEFHASAARGPEIAAFGSLAAVSANMRENFTETAAHVGKTVSCPVWERVRELTEQGLDKLGPLIEARAQRGVPCDTHGDLRLGHVYSFPEKAPPGDLVILDCIEFNDRFRYSDPVADAAFLVMDIVHQGCRDLVEPFAQAYFRAARNTEGAALMSLYVAYRSVVRAKVNGLKAVEPEVSEQERERASASAAAHWQLALGALEEPARRPWLLLVAGLPGSGKTTLARRLAEIAGYTVLRSDVIRKELTGVAPATSAPPEAYAVEATVRTYAECLRRAREFLLQGGRVLIDANFRLERQRLDALDLALGLDVPFIWLDCQVSPEIAQQRLSRRRGDASDADWRIHEQARATWEEPGPVTARYRREVRADGPPEETLAAAMTALQEAGTV